MLPRTRFHLVALFCSVLLVAPAVLSDVGDNDAGSGQDAGNSPSTALALPAEGNYTGTLSPTTEADWYTLDTSAEHVFCVEATALGSVSGPVTLALDEDLEPGVTRELTSQTQVSMGLAGLSIDDAWLGLDGTTAPVTGEYAFSLQGHTWSELGPGDGASGGDAGSTPSTRLALPGPCTRGVLDRGNGDQVDVFTFDGVTGEPLTLSLIAADWNLVTVELLAPNGSAVLTLESADMASTVLDATGLWSLEVTSSMQGGFPIPYVLGVSDGPEPRPCRPMCLGIE